MKAILILATLAFLGGTTLSYADGKPSKDDKDKKEKKKDDDGDSGGRTLKPKK